MRLSRMANLTAVNTDILYRYHMAEETGQALDEVEVPGEMIQEALKWALITFKNREINKCLT